MHYEHEYPRKADPNKGRVVDRFDTGEADPHNDHRGHGEVEDWAADPRVKSLIEVPDGPFESEE